MPNRILKESITSSGTIDSLTAEEERFFYRLIVACDDYGRYDARPRMLLGHCFPLKIGVVTEEDIGRWLNRLVDVGLVRQYWVDGRPYLHIVTWERHQQMRAKRSKYPDIPPNDGAIQHMQASDIGGDQPLAIVPVSGIRESNTYTEPNDSAEAPHAIEIQEVFGFYKASIQPHAITYDPKLIRARLGKFGPDSLKLAIEHFAADAWEMEHNSHRGATWFFRSDQRIEQYVNMIPRKVGTNTHEPQHRNIPEVPD